MPQINPLTDMHLECCNRTLQTTPDLIDYIKKCRDIGIDCDDRENVVHLQDEMARKTKAHFFPHKP